MKVGEFKATTDPTGGADVEGLRSFDIDPLLPEQDLQNKFCRQAHDFWKTRDPSVPFHVDDALVLPEVVPNLAVFDRLVDEDDFVFRFVGTNIVQATQRDLTGQRVLGVESKAALTKGFCRYFLEHDVPGLSTNSYTVSQEGAIFQFEETLGLPVLNEAGAMRVLLVHGQVWW